MAELVNIDELNLYQKAEVFINKNLNSRSIIGSFELGKSK